MEYKNNKKFRVEFTNDSISSMLLKAFEGQDVFIKKIERKSASLYGANAVIGFNDGKTPDISIMFLNERLEVENADKETIRKIYTQYYNGVVNKYPQYGKEISGASVEIKTFLKEMKDYFYDVLFEQGGFLCADKVSETIKQYRYGSRIENINIGNHVEFYSKIEARENKLDLRRIRPGQIFVADLNPVVDGEYGGVRPVLVIGISKDGETLTVIPFSSQADNGKSVGFFNGKENFAVVNKRKIISPKRLERFVGRLDDETYTRIVAENEEHFAVSKGLDQESIGYFRLRENTSNVIKKIAPEESENNFFSFKKLNERKLEMPTKEEILKMVEEHTKILTMKYGWKFSRQRKPSGNVENIIDYQDVSDTCVTVVLNDKYQDPKHKQYRLKLEFTPYSVKSSFSSAEDKYEKDLSYKLRKLMLEKNEYYYLLLTNTLVMHEFKSYSKAKERFPDRAEAIKAREALRLKDSLEELGIFYKGSYEELVELGSAYIDFNQVSYDPEYEEENV